MWLRRGSQFRDKCKKLVTLFTDGAVGKRAYVVGILPSELNGVVITLITSVEVKGWWRMASRTRVSPATFYCEYLQRTRCRSLSLYGHLVSEIYITCGPEQWEVAAARVTSVLWIAVVASSRFAER